MNAEPPPISDDDTPVEELPLVLPRRRPQADTEIDITPMIDIVFLLLIFFLVTSKLAQSASVTLPEAHYGDPIPAKESVVITLQKIDNDGSVALYLGDGKTDNLLVRSSDPASQADELAAYVEAGLQGPPRKQYVLLKADRDVLQREIARVSRAVGRIEGVKELYIAVAEVE